MFFDFFINTMLSLILGCGKSFPHYGSAMNSAGSCDFNVLPGLENYVNIHGEFYLHTQHVSLQTPGNS